MVVTLSKIGSVLLYFCVFMFSSALVKKRMSKYMRVIIVAFLPIIMGGIRYYVGADYGGYLTQFNEESSRTLAFYFKNFSFMDVPIGFNLVRKFTSVCNSSFLYFAITSALSYIPVVLFVIQEWGNKEDEFDIASRSLFVYLICFYIFGFAAIRQGIAIGFCVYALTFVFERKPIKFIILVVIAATFHSTALVCLPVYFLWSENGKVKIWKRIVVIAACFAFVYGLEDFVEVIGGRYSGYSDEVFGNNLTFWIMLFWAILFLYFRKHLVAIDARNELFILLFVMGTILQLLGFTNAFTKRIGQYFLVSQCFLLPQLIGGFTKNSRKMVWYLIVVFEWILFIMQYVVLGQSSIVPYSFIM